MPTRPDPAQPDEDPALEPIRVLRPRRTDALAELFKELEREGGGYESVAVPRSLPGAEDATQELPPVVEETRIAPRGGVVRPGPAASGPGFRRAAVAVTVTAAAVVGFGGALLLSGRVDGAAAGAQDQAPSATASAPAESAPGAPGAGEAGGSGDSSACTASFRTVNSWQGGYQGEVTVTNAPASPVSGWTATVVPDGGARLTQVWDGTLTTTRDGSTTVANASWNGSLAPGASVTFGFIAHTSQSGAPSAEVTCAATAGAS
ncbi:cellulose binding domain-containing protein [Streptomyces sp. NPDC057623]|uniref:cellulose binding domain-containing protein n=1 Tax=Streptomyces sp. NPDC057623 TaxID=3346187 RepID=UPI0036BE0829